MTTTVQAQSLLLVCGLSKKCIRTIAPKPNVVAKSNVVAKPDAWKAFAIEQNLNEEYFYFDRHKVKNILVMKGCTGLGLDVPRRNLL
jgi:hypothetical protein